MYHADFVTGQHIRPGDDVVAFVLAAAPGAGGSGSTPTQPSYEYRVDSLPLFGKFVEGGAIKVDEHSAGARYTMACRKRLSQKGRRSDDDDCDYDYDHSHDKADSAKSIADLVENSPPLAFLLPETFRMLVGLAQEQAYGDLAAALSTYRRLQELLATREGKQFQALQASLKEDENAYCLASMRNRKEAQTSPLGKRLAAAKEAFGLEMYERFADVAQAVESLKGSMSVDDPFTGAEIELPMPLYIFSTNYWGRCVSPVLGVAFSSTGEDVLEAVIEGLLHIQQVDFALMLLGRLWGPSLYKGDEDFPEIAAGYAAHLCSTSMEAILPDARYAAKLAGRPKESLGRYETEHLNKLQLLLPKLKAAAAQLQATIKAIEDAGVPG